MNIINLIAYKDDSYELIFIDDKGNETYAAFLTDEDTKFSVFEIGVDAKQYNKYKTKITAYLKTNFKKIKEQYVCV